ncbi:DUF6290 family protein [Exiguobacterium sp. s127]|uniref:DUF6290 family protein n=1 Tax=Exiguobacterium sp. s127 TaxID=2751210 RepID=UPI003339C3F0
MVQTYTEAKNITISHLMRDLILNRIENENNLTRYRILMAAHEKKFETVTFENTKQDAPSGESHDRSSPSLLCEYADPVFQFRT